MIEIRLLGVGEINAGEGMNPDAMLAQPKRLAVLSILALPKPGSMHRRDALRDLFWPDVDIEHSRMALRQALSHIRRALGNDVITKRGADDVGLNPALVWCDVAAFESELDRENWAKGVELYGGELLEGLILPNAPELTRWLDAERHRLAGRYAFALEELANAATESGNTRAAVEWW